MTDESASADHSRGPDYALDEVLELSAPEQYRALFEESRSQIVTLLLDRAATTSELAEVLQKPKGTVGHHLKTLERAGLVHVVRTERVRALEAKYYGRTARLFLYRSVGEALGEAQRVLARAGSEAGLVDEATAAAQGLVAPYAYRRHARIPAARAAEWHQRLSELVMEFAGESGEGESTYALIVAMFPTRGLAPGDGPDA